MVNPLQSVVNVRPCVGLRGLGIPALVAMPKARESHAKQGWQPWSIAELSVGTAAALDANKVRSWCSPALCSDGPALQPWFLRDGR